MASDKRLNTLTPARDTTVPRTYAAKIRQQVDLESRSNALNSRKSTNFGLKKSEHFWVWNVFRVTSRLGEVTGFLVTSSCP